MDLKRCSRCKEHKELPAFSNNPNGTFGKNTYCKPCSVDYMREYIAKNKDVLREKNRLRYQADKDRRYKVSVMRKYGMSAEELDDLFRASNGRCAVCGTTEPGRNGRMSIDHCHKTGKVRGLLCNRCNRALGLFGDSVDVLRSAASYLQHEGAAYPPGKITSFDTSGRL